MTAARTIREKPAREEPAIVTFVLRVVVDSEDGVLSGGSGAWGDVEALSSKEGRVSEGGVSGVAGGGVGIDEELDEGVETMAEMLAARPASFGPSASVDVVIDRMAVVVGPC